MLRTAGIAVYPIIIGVDYLYHPLREASGKLTWQANGEKADITMIEKLVAETGGHILVPDEIVREELIQEKVPKSYNVCLFMAVFFLALAGFLEFW